MKYVWLLSMLKIILLLHIFGGKGDALYFSDFLKNSLMNSIYLYLSNLLIKFVNAFIKY